MKEIIFIGDRFYQESNTVMSSVYEKSTDDTYRRYDYGFLQRDLKAGICLFIRPSTKDEQTFFDLELIKLKERLNNTVSN
ncbi:MAG: hypothetical protein PHQ35_11070 [Phycisphaerae bacterium]|nr:hypothetical protein [Phycisphaerae bacterium]